MTNSEAASQAEDNQHLVGKIFEDYSSKKQCRVIMIKTRCKSEGLAEFDVLVTATPTGRMVTEHLKEELNYFCGTHFQKN
jgi:hypothetical protein